MDWFEDDEFWRELFPVMFPADRFEVSAAQVGQVLKLAGIESGDVLDLCCGPGRHSCELARRGFRVTGVDRSEYLLSHAKNRAIELGGLPVEWVRADMREFRRAGAFDLACNLFTSFGYFEPDEENVGVLHNVCEGLRPGGVFVMDVLGKERVARIFQSAMATDFPGGVTLLQRPRICDDWTHVENEWTVIRDGRSRTFQFRHWVYSALELKERLLGAGFEKVDVFGDLGGAPYGVDATRLVAVARKAS